MVMYHKYNLEQLTRAVALWTRIVNSPHTEIQSWINSEEELIALIVTDGDTQYGGWTIETASYSDYWGSDVDAANCAVFVQKFGWNEGGDGRHGERHAWINLGELPEVDGDTDVNLSIIESWAGALDRLDDYPLLDDDVHSEYVHGLATAAWDEYLWYDICHQIPEELDKEAVREAYYSFEGNEWVCETATSACNMRHEDAVRFAIESLS